MTSVYLIGHNRFVPLYVRKQILRAEFDLRPSTKVCVRNSFFTELIAVLKIFFRLTLLLKLYLKVYDKSVMTDACFKVFPEAV